MRRRPDLLAKIWSHLVLLFLDAVLRWSEIEAFRRRKAGSSINKGPFSMAVAVHGGSGIPSFSSRHGDEEEEGFPSSIDGRIGKPQGSSEAAPGSLSTAALRRQPLKMVVRRPLPPSLSASVTSGRRLKVHNNLQAHMPRRRPSCSTAVGSRSSPQVVLSPVVRFLTAWWRGDVVDLELDPMAFIQHVLGSSVQKIRARL